MQKQHDKTEVSTKTLKQKFNNAVDNVFDLPTYEGEEKYFLRKGLLHLGEKLKKEGYPAMKHVT